MKDKVNDIVRSCKEVFGRCGLGPGDNIFLHSSLVMAAFQSEITDSRLLCETVLRALRETVGDGIVAVSSATWETSSQQKDFFLHSTPCSKDIGLFSEYLRQHCDSTRSNHPVCSIVMNSPCAEFSEYGLDRHRYAYGLNSPWAAMVGAGFKVVFFGLPNIQQLSLIHHIEQCCGVPYVYNKVFSCRVHGENGTENGDFCFSVPYQDHPIQISDFTCLKSAGGSDAYWREEKGLYGSVQVATMRDVFDLGLLLLRNDPYAFLNEPPRYQVGKVPVDRFVKAESVR